MTTRAANVHQQCRAWDWNSATMGLRCDSPHCTPTDFCPELASFTVGCWNSFNDIGVSGERYAISTDSFNGSVGSGFHLGWDQPSGGTGRLLFQVDPSGGGAEVELLSFSFYGPDEHLHHVGRFTFNGVGPGLLEQIINGELDGNTTSAGAITACDDDFVIGGPLTSLTATGFRDECFYATEPLDDETICRIAVCGIDGCGCSCQVADPTLYEARPRHVDDGGFINCTMPDCNQASPGYVTTTSTSTSSTTSTVATTTSTSSTTTTTL